MSCPCMMKHRPPRTRNAGDAPTETQLWVDNNERLYRQKLAIWNALLKKCRRGVFNAGLAQKAFRHVTDAAAVTYKKEVGEPLPVSDRREAERDFVAQFMAISTCRPNHSFTAEQEARVKKEFGIRRLGKR